MGGKRFPPTSFLPPTSTGISPQNFFTFRFDSFATLLQNFKAMPSTSPKSLNLKQDQPQKKSDHYKIEVTITFFLEMLELPNFGHMTTSTTTFKLREKILLLKL